MEEPTGEKDPTLTPPPSSDLLSAARVASEAADVVRHISGRAIPDRITLRNGIVLRLQPVPPFALREAAILVPPPQVPVVFIEDKGREEPNPNDPDYLKALENHANAQSARVADTLMLLGTAVESLPDYVEPPEGTEWSKKLRSLGMEIDTEDEHKRYLAWLRLYAFTSALDISQTTFAVTRLTGVTEEEVRRVAAAFRNTA